MNITEYIVKLKNTFLDPKTLNSKELLSTLEESSVYEDFYMSKSNDNLSQKILEEVNNIKEDVVDIGDDVYNDIEFFKCFTDKNTSTIIQQIDSCNLSGSKLMLKKLFETPTYNKDILRTRQDLLKEIESKINNTNLDFVVSKESEVLWLYDEIDQNLKDLYDMVFFRFCLFKPLNDNPAALTVHNIYRIVCSPFIGIMSPILYVIIPYIVIVMKLKLKIKFKVYLKIMLTTLMSGDMFTTGKTSSYTAFRVMSYVLSIIFYFQGILNSFEVSRTLNKISGHLVNKVNNIVEFLQKCNAINKHLWNDKINSVFMNYPSIKTLEDEDKYLSNLEILPFNIFSNFGKQLHTYIKFDKDIIKSIMIKSYVLDALTSILSFKNKLNISYVDYIESPKPLLSLKDSFHPCIDFKKVVKNDIDIGGDFKNAILTGPNAGGKSTFVKNILINSILCQTVGLCIAKFGEITPFHIINSQINIPDCKGYESLFEAEMYRCKSKLDQLRNNSGRFSLFIMDEIFNSTNPVEGIAGAYAIAKKMSEYPDCVLMLTTHYIYLTKLHKFGRFINYKMNVIKDNDTITYPYQLSQGVSRQYIALDLLKKNGFDEDIIDEALMIKDKLVSK